MPKSVVQKRHFEIVAQVLKRSDPEYALSVHEVATRFADEFAKLNPKFKRTQFLKECGL